MTNLHEFFSTCQLVLAHLQIKFKLRKRIFLPSRVKLKSYWTKNSFNFKIKNYQETSFLQLSKSKTNFISFSTKNFPRITSINREENTHRVKTVHKMLFRRNFTSKTFSVCFFCHRRGVSNACGWRHACIWFLLTQ